MLPYQKFPLQPVDCERLLEDLLPWYESWVAAISSSQHRVRDPDDQMFLDLALAAAPLSLPCKSSTQPDNTRLRTEIQYL